MTTNKITPEELWARQQISPLDVDYNLWNERRAPMERIKRTVINRKTGEILASAVVPADQQLTKREKEILLLIRQGFLSKEIASKLNLSIYTVHNHRKNILAKLKFYKRKNVLYFVFVAVMIILKNSMKKCLNI